tara:strand:- start:399 stop:578 length:180 start_codon:yes stop_codon:yes gene_type:complete
MDKEVNALIKFNVSELQWLILALVHAKNSSETFSNSDYGNAFEKLKNDLIKIKNKLEDN